MDTKQTVALSFWKPDRFQLRLWLTKIDFITNGKLSNKKIFLRLPLAKRSKKQKSLLKFYFCENLDKKIG